MIKLLTDNELEGVSGGFMGRDIGRYLIAEAGPQRLLVVPGANVSATPTQSTDIQQGEAESPSENPTALDFQQTFNWGGPASLSALGRYQIEGNDRNVNLGRYSIRASDISMERKARAPEVQSWKTPFLNR